MPFSGSYEFEQVMLVSRLMILTSGRLASRTASASPQGYSGPTPVGIGQFAAYEEVFPDVDKSVIRFHGTWLTAQIRRLYLRAASSFPSTPLARGVSAGLALVVLAPVAWLANRAAAERDATNFTPNWTSAVLELEVVRKPDLPQSTHPDAAEPACRRPHA